MVGADDPQFHVFWDVGRHLRLDKLSEVVYGGSSATQTPAKSGTYSLADVCKPPEDCLPSRWGGESGDKEEEARVGVT